jgi:CheY-like chemotaxis protein
MIIDDCKDLRELMAMLFESRGYDVTVAESGQRALDLLDQGYRPNLILVDHGMENVGGLEFILKFSIRYQDLRGDVPLVLFTGATKMVIGEHGADRVLNKPASIAKLLEVAHEYLH